MGFRIFKHGAVPDAGREVEFARARPLRELKWLGVVWVVAVLVAVGSYGVTGWLVERRYDRAVAALKARGLPSTIEDLQPPEVPDERNAGKALLKAVAKLVTTPGWPSWSGPYIEPGQRRDSADWWLQANASSVQNAPALEAALAALELPDVDFGINLKRKPINLLVQNQVATAMMNLQSCASDEMLRCTYVGDVEGMLKCHRLIQSILRLRSSLTETGFETFRLASWQQSNAYDILVLASFLRIGDKPGDLSPDQVRSLIAEYIQVDEDTEKELRGYRAQILVNVALLDIRLAEGAITPPLWRGTQARMLEIAGESDPVTEQLPLDPGDYFQPVIRDYFQPVRMVNPSTIARRMTYQDLSRRRVSMRVQCDVAAIALAFHWYRAEHGGAFPPSLEDLVPRYLPKMPVDATDPAGGPYGYLIAEGGTRPVVTTQFFPRDSGNILPPEANYWYHLFPGRANHYVDLMVRPKSPGSP